MALKVVLMIAMVLFSLGTMPAPTDATRLDVAELLDAIDIPTGKSLDAGSDESCYCACTRKLPPPNYCICKDPSACPKCVCKYTLNYYGVPVSFCDSIAQVFASYCGNPSLSNNEGTHPRIA